MPDLDHDHLNHHHLNHNDLNHNSLEHYALKHCDPNTDALIPCTLLSSLIQYAQSLNLPYHSWFDTLQLDTTDILQGQAFISFSNLQYVFQQAQPHFVNQALGIELAKTSGLGSMGLLGFVMQSSSTVAQAFEAGLRFHQISGSVMNLEATFQNDVVVLEIQHRYDIPTDNTSNLNIMFTEEIIASIVNSLRALLGQQHAPNHIDFAYAEPSYSQQYHDFFQCPLSFTQAYSRIYFPQAILQQPIITANAANYHQAIQICEQHLSKLQQQSCLKLSSMIAQHLLLQLPHRVTLRELSTHFELSERQLYRQLQQEGTSFQTLKQKILLAQAQQLLMQHHSIESISQRLGFYDAREFRRAFKRWTNTTPSHFRNAIQP